MHDRGRGHILQDDKNLNIKKRRLGVNLDLALFYLFFFPFAFFLTVALAFALTALPPPPPILNIFVPQTEHVPVVAGRPFFMVICLSPLISLFALHFTQYPTVANNGRSSALGYKNSCICARFVHRERKISPDLWKSKAKNQKMIRS
jgi:hypothetical protein